MSWKPIKMGLPRRVARSASPTKPMTLEPVPRTTHDVRRAYLRRQNTVVTPAGLYTFARGRQPQTQDLGAPSLQPLPRGLSAASVNPSSSGQRSSSVPAHTSSDHGWSSSFSDPYELPSDTTLLKVSKAKKQWEKWSTEIIPSLLQPYLHLLRVTDALRNLRHNEAGQCTCGGTPVRQLNVVFLFFDGMFFFVACIPVLTFHF